MTIKVRMNSETVEVQVIRKVSTGFRVTHNHDGKYRKIWAITPEGTIYCTKSTGQYRVALPQDVPPPSLFACTETEPKPR